MKAETTLQWTAIFTSSVVVVGTILVMRYLPDTIPIHYNFAGEPDGYGGKESLWMFPILSLFITGLFAVIRRHPDHMNYPFPITESNRERQRELSFMLLSTINIAVNVIFGFIVYSSLPSVQQGGFIFPVLLILALVFVPIGFYFYLAYKAR